MRWLWLGAYERDYPRGAVLREGLRALGHDVVECHVPLWERTRHKTGAFLAPASLARTGVRAAGAWAALARRERAVGHVDVVVAGYPAQPDMPLARWVARRRRVPLVADLMISLADTLGGDRGVGGRVAAVAGERIDRFAARSADVVMTDTEANARWFTRTFGLAPGRAVAVPVGAEPAVFPPAPPPGGPPRALFVGKLAPLHGLATVLAAARRPGTPPLTIVGDGQLRGWLDEELRRDPPAGVTHIPWVPYEELGGLIARHHIALGVFGSSDKASRVVANKVWQALAVGRPVVTAGTPGAREVLRDGVDALLVPVGDPAALAAALGRLGGDGPLRARLGEAGRATYARNGTPEAVASRLVAAVEACR